MRFILLLLFAMTLAACSPADAGKAVSQSEQAVTAFHRDLNAGKFDEIYWGSGKEMKDSVDLSGFEEFLGAIHRKLGPAGKSVQQGWNVNFTNGRQYVTLTMETTFEKDKAIETFVYVTSDDGTKLLGYNVQSRALIVR